MHATRQSLAVTSSVHVDEPVVVDSSVEELPSLLELLSLSLPSPPGVFGGEERPGGMQGNENLGKPGKLNSTLMYLGQPKRTMPEPIPPHQGQPTRTGTTVESLEPLEVVVIHVLVVHSVWPDTVVGDQVLGGSVMVGVMRESLVVVVVAKFVEIGPVPQVVCEVCEGPVSVLDGPAEAPEVSLVAPELVLAVSVVPVCPDDASVAEAGSDVVSEVVSDAGRESELSVEVPVVSAVSVIVSAPPVLSAWPEVASDAGTDPDASVETPEALVEVASDVGTELDASVEPPEAFVVPALVPVAPVLPASVLVVSPVLATSVPGVASDVGNEPDASIEPPEVFVVPA